MQTTKSFGLWPPVNTLKVISRCEDFCDVGKLACATVRADGRCPADCWTLRLKTEIELSNVKRTG